MASLLSKLDAVNQMLEAIGEEPVNSLSSGLPDAEKAERFLNRIKKEVLAVGWHDNTDREKELTRRNDDTIKIPNNALYVDTTAEDADVNVSMRKKDSEMVLYNVDDEDFTFDRDLKCEIIRDFDFDELPLRLQTYIAAHAARLYQESEFGSVSLDSFVSRREQETWWALLDEEADREDTNVLLESPSLQWTHRNSRYHGI